MHCTCSTHCYHSNVLKVDAGLATSLLNNDNVNGHLIHVNGCDLSYILSI